jgi:hypothetical protein
MLYLTKTKPPLRGLLSIYGDHMRYPIEFQDQNGEPTSDYVNGFPIILLDIDPTIVPDERTKTFNAKLRRVRALIDTGANASMFSERVLAGSTPVGNVGAEHMGGSGTTDTFFVVIGIPKLLDLRLYEVGKIPLPLGIEVLVGRDILSKLRLVMDTPRREFYLEASA